MFLNTQPVASSSTVSEMQTSATQFTSPQILLTLYASAGVSSSSSESTLYDSSSTLPKTVSESTASLVSTQFDLSIAKSSLGPITSSVSSEYDLFDSKTSLAYSTAQSFQPTISSAASTTPEYQQKTPFLTTTAVPLNRAVNVTILSTVQGYTIFTFKQTTFRAGLAALLRVNIIYVIVVSVIPVSRRAIDAVQVTTLITTVDNTDAARIIAVVASPDAAANLTLELHSLGMELAAVSNMQAKLSSQEAASGGDDSYNGLGRERFGLIIGLGGVGGSLVIFLVVALFVHQLCPCSRKQPLLSSIHPAGGQRTTATGSLGFLVSQDLPLIANDQGLLQSVTKENEGNEGNTVPVNEMIGGWA